MTRASTVSGHTVLTLVIDGRPLVTTEDHPFWSVSDQQFERADHLAKGEKVLTADGTTASVDGLKLDTVEYAPAYNLTISQSHTYYVVPGDATGSDATRAPPGSRAVLVHNTGSCPLPGGAADAAGTAEKTFQTYTKLNPETGQVYVGRTSGTGSPLENLARRDASHAYNSEGFGAATLDRSGSYAAIRGREQQLIEHYRELGISANKINGISPSNPRRLWYAGSAFGEFGP